MISAVNRGRSILPLLAVLAVSAAVPAASSPAAEGWQKLWRNQNVEARARFRAALKQNPSNVEALRGLGLVNLQEDAELDALQAWRPLYKLAPSHWSAAALWPRVVELARSTGRWGLLEGAARDVIAAPGAPPELRASARLALAASADRAGKSAEAEKEWAALGFIRKWRVIGPFENVSRSGFEKAFPPEREIGSTRACSGKEDQPLHWHRLLLVSRDGQCAVGASLGDGTPSVYYAATALFSPQEQPAVLRWDPTGASKLIVNGRLLFSDDTDRVHQPLLADPFRAPVTLRKGWNSLLVKLADDGDTDAAFALRVTTPAGDALPGLQADPGQQVPSAAEAAPAAPAPAESATVALLRKPAEQDADAAVALAYHLRLAQEPVAAVRVLRSALQRAPEAGWLHWELCQALREDQQADEARAERDEARKQNPRLIAAALDALEDEEAAVPAAEAIKRLKALQKINPGSASLHWSLAGAYAEADLMAESLKEARLGAESAPGAEEISQVVRFYQLGDRKAEAEKVLAEALRAAPNAEVLLFTRAQMLAAGGKAAAAIPLYGRLLQLDPSEPWYRLQLAELYHGQRDLKMAAQTLRAARERQPQDAQVCARLADVLREMGRTKEALELYRAAVRLAPSQVALREKLQVLAGERPVLELAPATPAGPILAKAPEATGAGGASAVVLLDEMREVVYPDFATVAHQHQIIKVLDASAVERYQEFPLSVSSASASATVESARILKADGKVQDVTAGASPYAVPFPSLAPGDVIDITYRAEGYQRGGLARQFWASWFFTYSGAPVKLSRYVLITPPGMTFQMRAHGSVPEPVVKDAKGWRVREWRTTDVPAGRLEAMAPSTMDSGTWLDISTIPSWSHIVQWYRDLSQARCVPDAAIRAKAEELTRGAKTEEEKLRAVTAFVAREIQYQTTPFRMSAYVPTEGKQVLRERYGDCKDKAALLTALLAAVGIKSEMVLISGRSYGTVPYLPSPRFTHAIARVHTAAGPLWLDATADQMEFGGFPAELQGVPALVIDPATTDLTLTPELSVERNRMTDRHEGVLGADGKLAGSMELAATGDWGWMLRSVLRLVPEANREQALRGIAARLVEDARLESGSMGNLAETDKPLVLQLKYAADRYSTTAGSFVMARLPWGRMKSAATDALTSAGTRVQDMELTSLRGHYVSSVRLDLPAGFTPQELQPELRGESPWGSYRITYRMEGNVLHAESDVKITPLRVRAADAPKFVEFLRAIEQEYRRQLVFRKP